MTSEIDLTLDLGSNSPEAEPELPTAQFLKIFLAQNQSYLLPIEALVELAKVPIEQVVPMFGMPPWVAGVYNLRGEVLWIADLSHFLSLPPWYDQAEPTGQHALVVVQTLAPIASGDRVPKLGLIVNRIGDITHYPEADIQTDLSGLKPAPTTFIRGAVSRTDSAEQILDIHNILATMVNSQS